MARDQVSSLKSQVLSPKSQVSSLMDQVSWIRYQGSGIRERKIRMREVDLIIFNGFGFRIKSIKIINKYFSVFNKRICEVVNGEKNGSAKRSLYYPSRISQGFSEPLASLNIRF